MKNDEEGDEWMDDLGRFLGPDGEEVPDWREVFPRWAARLAWWDTVDEAEDYAKRFDS